MFTFSSSSDGEPGEPGQGWHHGAWAPSVSIPHHRWQDALRASHPQCRGEEVSIWVLCPSSTSYISPIGLTSHQMLLSSGHSIHKLEPRLFQTWSEMGHTGQVPNIQAGETQALRHTQRWGEDKFKLNAKNDFWFQDWRSCVTPTLCSTVNTILTDLLATLTRSWASTGPTSCTSPRGWGPSARQLVFIG